MKALVALMVLASGCCTATPKEVQLSGVWSYRCSEVMVHYGKFSWGMNPVGLDTTTIDLGATPIYAHFERGGFRIDRVTTEGDFYVFYGKWADTLKGFTVRGEVKIGVIDKDHIWIEARYPYPFNSHTMGKENIYCRVPIDAKVSPIDPSKGPRQ